MKYFSAQYLFTNAGLPLKRGVICTEDDGTIVSVEDSGGALSERHSVEFYNGIIVPGFVNCHCHLELSYLKNKIPKGSGLASFLMSVNSIRNSLQNDINQSIREADNELYKAGVVLCADICNTSKTFDLKKESRIKYINLLEVFGIDPNRAQHRMDEIIDLARLATEMGIPYYIVPHAVYSVSLPLFRLIENHTGSNKITSIHFMESAGEVTLLENHTGSLMDSYKKFLPSVSDLKIAGSHLEAVEKEITPSGNLILIHNTFVERDQITKLKNRAGLYWCLCPNSNLYIEQRIAPVDIIAAEGCNIVIGTDSLSSNTTLSIIEELKTIQSYFPEFNLETLIGWATINGAKALCEDVFTGSIEPGKKPGLVLLENVDLKNMKLLPGTAVRRLI